jgi:hypothetical protein
MSNKLLLFSSSLSKCCRAKQLVVQSRAGGFVSQNCMQCERSAWISARELPTLRCSDCDVTLEVDNRWKNYCYACPVCRSTWFVYELVPWWHERFQWYGLAAPDGSSGGWCSW